MTELLVAMVLSAVALLIGVSAHRLRHRPDVLWGLGWGAVAVAAVALSTSPPSLVGPLVLFCSTLLPGAQVAGAQAFVRGAAASGWMPAVLGVALFRATAAGSAPLEGVLGSLIEPAVTLYAAFLLAGAARRPEAGRALRALPVALVAVAVLDGLTGTRPVLEEGFVSWPLAWSWALVSAATLSLQLHLASERRLASQRRLRTSTEAELAESQQRFRALTESAFDLTAELDGDARFTYVSPRYEEWLGLPGDAFIGRSPAEFVHPEDRPLVEPFAQRAADTGWATGLVVRALRSDGSWCWLENAARYFTTPRGERRWVLTSRDVTRRQAEEATREQLRQRLHQRLEASVERSNQALAESEARFRALADWAPELISEFDDSGRYLFANAAFRELLGREPGELIGTSPDALIHPEDVERSRDGMIRAMVGHRTARAVHRLRHADGTWRWFDNTGRAYHTVAGELRFVSIGRDVTEARRAEEERRRLETHMHEMQRLESLGVLAGGVAHDFNNLLAVILGNAALLEDGLPADSDAASRVRRIQAAGRHAEGLTEQMLTYAGRSGSKRLPLDLSKTVRETEDLLRAAVSNGARLEIELAEDLPLVEGDATQLRQVLLNLVTNASEALGDAGGRVWVHTASRDAGEAWLADGFGTAEPEPGTWVMLEVGDDGPGMDEVQRARIFQPFYTTKRAGRGLGLAAVLGIAGSHHGLVKLDTGPGRGTRFRFLLPCTTAGRRAADPEAPDPRPAAETRGTVLVVDDEEAVREVTVALLERAGFRALAASGGREALAAVREGEVIDAVLLDLEMPGLSGADTLRALRAERPDLPIAVASGYTQDDALQRIGPDQPFVFLSKPFGAARLAASMGTLLGGSPTT